MAWRDFFGFLNPGGPSYSATQRRKRELRESQPGPRPDLYGGPWQTPRSTDFTPTNFTPTEIPQEEQLPGGFYHRYEELTPGISAQGGAYYPGAGGAGFSGLNRQELPEAPWNYQAKQDMDQAVREAEAAAGRPAAPDVKSSKIRPQAGDLGSPVPFNPADYETGPAPVGKPPPRSGKASNVLVGPGYGPGEQVPDRNQELRDFHAARQERMQEYGKAAQQYQQFIYTTRQLIRSGLSPQQAARQAQLMMQGPQQSFEPPAPAEPPVRADFGGGDFGGGDFGGGDF